MKMNESQYATSDPYSNFYEICEIIENNVTVVENEYESIIYGKQGYILWGILFVLIAFLGCIGNIITIIVLKRDPIMSSLNVLLIALAISDILAPLANALVTISFYHLKDSYATSVNYLKFDDILRHFIQPLATMFTMSSSWIVTATTLFRLIAVMWPFKARTLINTRFSIISLMIIFGFSLASIIPLYANLVRRIKCTPDRYQYVAFDMEVTSPLMIKAYLPMIQIMCFYLPWLIALTLWIFLLKSLRRSEKNFNVSFIAKETSTVMPFVNSSFNGSNKSNFIYNGIDRSSKRSNDYHGYNNTDNACNSLHASSYMDPSIRLINNNSGIIIQNNDSRMNNAHTRLRSYNKITLMVVVLCFTNLICRLFTFVFIFELIFNEYLKRNSYQSSQNLFDDLNNSSSATAASLSSDDVYLNSNSNQSYSNNINMAPIENARTHFPRFLSYSLLLNNIFLCINHSCNIFIYTFTNPRFKKNLLNFIRSGNFFRCFYRKLNLKRNNYFEDNMRGSRLSRNNNNNMNNSNVNDDINTENNQNNRRNSKKGNCLTNLVCYWCNTSNSTNSNENKKNKIKSLRNKKIIGQRI